MKVYKPISDREVARRLGIRSIHTAYYYLQTIQEIYDAGLIICERVSTDEPQREWIFKTVFPNDKSEFPMGYLECPVCGSHHSNSTPCNYCDNCGVRLKGADE